MSQPNLPDGDHIARYVPWAKVDKDDCDNVRGILWSAFQRRDDEDGLSVNWLERTGCENQEDALRTTVQFLRAGGLEVKKKARLAVANVKKFKEVCASRETKVRIIHVPDDGNEPHSEVRQIPREDLRLLEDLARFAVSSHHACGNHME